MQNPNLNFWCGKRVLLTGHTGFKGSWLAIWLSLMGAKVTGISLLPDTSPNLFSLCGIRRNVESYFIDISNSDLVQEAVNKIQPEIVLHLAAQALVRRSYRNPIATFSTNIMGTVNVLNALRGVGSVKSVVAVTTDKVYQNLEQLAAYREIDALGGYDPYSASKAAGEIVISSYRDSYFTEKGIAVASARAGNVIGGGDWSEDRLIPDAVRAWDADLPLLIRRPDAIRPWQHVLEPLCSYLILAEKIYEDVGLSGAYNFGPNVHEAATVRSVIQSASRAYGSGRIQWGDGGDGPHEAGILSLDVSKAANLLGIKPRWGLDESVERTMKWYLCQRQGASVPDLCEKEISDFIQQQS